jgi:PAS domain S-box-containing protein
MKAESPDIPSPASSSAKILIVEDNEMDALLLQETLREAGSLPLELTVAGQVSDAIRLLNETRFDVILSDLSLPDCRGLETFTRIFAQAPETPIILLTGFEDESLGLEAVRAGAQEYVVKGTMNGKALWRVISYAIERQSLEKAVRDSEKRYKRLLGSVTDYIYTVKVENGRGVSTTHGPGCAQVTGFTPEELDRDPHLWHRMVHEEDRLAVLKQAARVLAGDPVTLEHRIIHQDGSVRWVRHTPVLRRDDQERVIGYDGLISDITERKQAEEALRRAIGDLQQSREALKTAHLQLIQSEKMETVGRMAAGVAHEVQNPLQILLMSLDYLSLRMADAHDAVLDGVINDMRHAARRADTIIRGLLDFSHSETLELKPQDLNALIEKAALLVRHQLASGHIKLQLDLGTGLPPLALDGVKIEQVFVNLFTNAIDAMPKGGTLTVKTSKATLAETHRDPGAREAGHFYAGDTVVQVEVEDTGSGIAPEVLRKIFDPFFTTKATGKGTGLGLAIVKRILDLHNGSIEIRNRAEGGAQCQLMFKTRDPDQN